MFTIINNKLMFTDTAYNIGKKLVLVIIPGLSFILFILSFIWGLPDLKNVVGMLAIFAFVLGTCLVFSSRQYEESGAAYDGQMIVVIPEDGPKLFSLQLDGDPEELEHKKSITFKIGPREAPI